jgi:hypothetical protein
MKLNGFFLGAYSQLAQKILKQYEWNHLLLHSQSLKQLQQLVSSLPSGVSVELFPCDFKRVHEKALIEFTERLQRLSHLDVIVFTVGSWSSHTAFEHLTLEELYIAWQVNYFYPLSLLKAALPLTRPGMKLIVWNLEDELLPRPLWTAMSPILAASKIFFEQIVIEQKWVLEVYSTGFVRSAQSLKLFPSGEHCVLELAEHSF